MEAEQLPSAYVPSMPTTAYALQRSAVLNNNLSSTKTVVVKMQYFIFSLFYFVSIRFLNIELFVLIFMDKCRLCLIIVSH